MENGKVSILAGGGEPMAAVLFGVLFFMEIPSALNLAGLVITVVALSLLCMPAGKPAIAGGLYRRASIVVKRALR